MFDKVLKSGRKVNIKELTIDQVDDLNDMTPICFVGLGVDVARTVKNQNKGITAWIRCGLIGGDFDDWKPNGVGPPDSVLKQLSEDERDELAGLIKNCQTINPKKPSSSA